MTEQGARVEAYEVGGERVAAVDLTYERTGDDGVPFYRIVNLPDWFNPMTCTVRKVGDDDTPFHLLAEAPLPVGDLSPALMVPVLKIELTLTQRMRDYMSYIHTANLVLIVVATVIGGVLYSPVPASVGVAFAVAIDIFSSRFARALATREYSKATGMEPGVIDVNRTFGHE